ncbi:MAG: AsmA-like C-terminal region-containing protein, partial [Thermodesulfobacteriota bacterium]|nr:AsmA-like C-terminal region-containing protein [Thermodesulfobacteriota bacterium]
CDFSKKSPDIQMTIDAQKVSLSQDVTLLGYIIPILIKTSEGTLSGKVDLSAQASWQGLEWDSEISRTIDGKGNLSVSEGTVQSRNVLAEILKFAGQSEKLEFEQIITGFRLSDGKIFNDDIQVNGDTLDFNLKGWTSLAYLPSKQGNPLEYTVTGDWIDKSLGRDAKKVLSVLGGGETTIPIVIAGTVQNPRVTIKKPKAEDVVKGFLKSRQKEK